MKVILIQDTKNLGKAGDVKDVSEGYARNFLLPKKLVAVASEGIVKVVQEKKEEERVREIAAVEKLRAKARQLEKERISLKVKEKKGKLFGAITKKQIADELRKSNLDVLEKCIIMEKVIKKTGVYEIEIKLDATIKARIQLEVSGE